MSAVRREGGRDSDPPRWDGLPVLVLGLGVSGAASARALAGVGAAVCAVDADDSPALRARAAALAAAGVDARLRCGQPDLVSGRRLVVTSPGVRPDHPVVVAASEAGVPVWSEPELAWRLSGGRARLVAVTGTNGKTTTAQLLADCLAAPAAGNIGTPLVDVLATAVPPSVVVAELSSFQLHFADRLRPAVAVLLNVAPDHLDWHGSLDSYAAAKARVWARQRPVHGGGRDDADWAVVNVDDPGARELAARHPPPGRVVGFTLAGPTPGRVGVADGRVVANVGGSPVDVVGVDELGLAGRHNLANVCAAVAAAVCAGAEPAALAAPLRRFRSGPHRLEHVATIDGVAWVDDSKATNP
ncbi:MAG TPA: UDP-N-acetylmuramoyl-L-alanine--D-glutamate ligase, partial [Egibacteraceae bacterium]|nr:UDP-N-acetylmuramoyl-L-alanine--D-glutamate ligase [Egibacteraceae bacterium]